MTHDPRDERSRKVKRFVGMWPSAGRIGWAAIILFKAVDLLQPTRNGLLIVPCVLYGFVVEVTRELRCHRDNMGIAFAWQLVIASIAWALMVLFDSRLLTATWGSPGSAVVGLISVAALGTFFDAFLWRHTDFRPRRRSAGTDENRVQDGHAHAVGTSRDSNSNSTVREQDDAPAPQDSVLPASQETPKPWGPQQIPRTWKNPFWTEKDRVYGAARKDWKSLLIAFVSLLLPLLLWAILAGSGSWTVNLLLALAVGIGGFMLWRPVPRHRRDEHDSGHGR